jgi:hypothetical protein
LQNTKGILQGILALNTFGVCHKAPGKTPKVFCSKVPIAISGQSAPCSSGNHFPIGYLPQNTFGILPGVLQQNTKGV